MVILPLMEEDKLLENKYSGKYMDLRYVCNEEHYITKNIISIARTT